MLNVHSYLFHSVSDMTDGFFDTIDTFGAVFCKK